MALMMILYYLTINNKFRFLLYNMPLSKQRTSVPCSLYQIVILKFKLIFVTYLADKNVPNL